jgi:hypothetical protein
MPVYQISFPFKTQIFFDTEKSIVYFEFLKPKPILAMIGINFETVNTVVSSNA